MYSSLKVSGFLQDINKCGLQFVRFKNKINITHPRPPHFQRAIVETICVPKFDRKNVPDHVPLYDKCNVKSIKVTEDSPIKKILAKELFNWLSHSKLIAIFHENFMDEEDKFEHYVLLKKNKMKVLYYNKSIVKESTSGTIYEPINHFYQSPHTLLAICPEPDLYNLMSILKQLPLMTLMGAIINLRLLDYSQLTNFGQIKSLEQARVNFVGLLSMPAQNLLQQLNYHPNSLVQSMLQIKDKKD